MIVLSIGNLTKIYGKIRALDHLSLEIHQGQTFGLLGPNGSGKTTTLGIVLGIIYADEGNYTWFDGRYGSAVRTRLGALLETPNFYPYLDADENLGIIRHIKRSGEKNFDHLLELVGLRQRRTTKFAGYSFGMRQRLAIAAALVGDPECLILDEPTNGLDPEGIADVRNTILQIADAGKTILLASHMLDEVERICSHVAILKGGRLLASGPVGSVLSDEVTLEIQADEMDRLEAALATIPQLSKWYRKGPYLEVTAEKGLDPASLNRELMSRGIALRHLAIRKQSLESGFLEIINQ